MRPNLPPRNRLARGGNTCDFCGGLFVARMYACSNFEWDGRPVFRGDVGRWTACDVCANLIDAPKWGRLHSRVIREVRKRAGLTVAELDYLSRDLRQLHAAIRENMIPGEAWTVSQPHYVRVGVA